MLPKIAYVIIVGLPDEERKKLDESTLRMLHFSDPSWKYHSYGCATLQEAVEMARGMDRIDILFIARDIEPCGFVSAQINRDFEIAQKLMQEHPSKPVLSYNDENRDNKLAISIFSLWRDRNKAQQ